MKISVIIPLYNKEHYILSTLQSVIEQSYKDWEAIIINDGSTDNSVEVVKTISDPRIRLYNQENQGISAARNRGIHLASGEFIALLDADDTWPANYLEVMVGLAENYPKYSIFAVAQKNRPIKTLPTGISIIEDYCTYNYIFWTGSMLVKKSVYDEVGYFRVGIQPGEDIDMWLRMHCKYKSVYLNEELVDHPYVTENNFGRIYNPEKSLPVWEWYDYPYHDKKKLYRYTTEQLTLWANIFATQKNYNYAWIFLSHSRGFTTIRPRLKLLLRILFRY